MRMWLVAPLMAATILSAALPSAALAQARGDGARSGGGFRGGGQSQSQAERPAATPRGNWGGGNWNGASREPRSTMPSPARETIDATRSRPGGEWRATRGPAQGAAQGTAPSVRPATPRTESGTTWQQRRATQGWQGNRANDGNWRTRDRNGDGIADATQREQWRQQQRAGQNRENWQQNRQNQNWQGSRAYRPNSGYYGNNNWNRGSAQRLSDRDRWNGVNRWDRDWRRDSRYDWQGWRAANRGYYHMPAYYAPYGWDYGYRRFSIGIFLTSGLFASNYWIDDPAYYRLPPAYGTLRWIRYYDDALLVDMRDGYVVDVVYDFFW